MDALIGDLLTYSRTIHKDALPVGSADLSEALAEAVALRREGIEASGAAITAPSLPMVRGETQHLAHVFQKPDFQSFKISPRRNRPTDRHLRGVSWR